MRIALTGPDGDGGSLGEGLRALGVGTASHPLLLAEAASAAPARAPDLVAFTSARAVDALGDLAGPPAGRPCLAVGPGTARRAAAAGWKVAVEGTGAGANGLLAALDAAALPVRGRRVLLPRSGRALPVLEDGLRARGAEVEAIAAYEVRPAPDAAARVLGLVEGRADVAVVASPSAAEALAAGAGEARDALPPLVAIGPTTAEAMEALGLPVAGVAAAPTPEGILRTLGEVGMSEGTPSWPVARPRRLRRTEAIRRLVRETRITPDRFVAPMFVVAGRGVREPIPSMPGVFRVSPEIAAREAQSLAGLGIGGAILFGIPGSKDADGSSSWDPDGPVCTALRAIRDGGADLALWADVCLCEYTDHGHCGRLAADGTVDNDATLPLLARAAVAYARAGADAVAPSDMMDGRVRAIRGALDRESLTDTAIVSYAVKYASAFYGPFRDAAGSAPKQGDRRGYQMDPANAREALREAALDEAEGADILMVKPALPCLDIVRRVRDATNLPVAAYQVSGEWAMLQAAAERGWVDRDRALLETLTAIRRAGADLIVTYGAADAARLLA